MKKLSTKWLLLPALLLLPSCSRQPRQALELLPADTLLVVRLPDPAAAAGHLDGLLERLAQGPARLFLSQFRKELLRRLGFDPRNAEQWRRLGVDPAAGLTVGLLKDGQAVVVLGVTDRAALRKTLAARMKELAAADQSSSQQVSGVEVTTLSARVGTGSVARLRMAFAGRLLLLAGPAVSADRLAALAGQEREASLAAAGWFDELRERLPRKTDLLLVANPGAAAIPASAGTRSAAWPDRGAALALDFGSGALAARLFVGLEAGRAGHFRALVEQVPDTHLEGKLPASSLLVLKLRADPRKLLGELGALQPERARELQERGKRLEKRLGREFLAATIDNLTGNLVLGIGLTARDSLGRLAGGEGAGADVDRLEQEAWLLAWAELRQPQLFRQLLADLLRKVGEGFPGKQHRLGPLEVTEITTPQGRHLSLLLAGNLAGLCLGKSCQQLAAGCLAGKAGNLAASLAKPARAQLNRANLASGLLRLDRLLEFVRHLDVSALGSAGSGLKALLQLAIAVLGKLGELGLAVEPVSAGGLLQVNLWLK